MNSYPPELLVQLAPVIDAYDASNASNTGDASTTSGTSDISNTSDTGSPTIKESDPFAVLAVRLRDALISQRKASIWQPEKSKTFQIILVDKVRVTLKISPADYDNVQDVRFPPRKLLHPEDPQHNVSHSPLSPLTPSSPLYPDGLIAPIWVRKHTTLVPSVFVMFTRIYESPTHPSRPPPDGHDPDRDREKEAEERRRDTELSAEISQRKRITNERGIKLTVVLMASRRMLDDPSLDARLTYIRRQSGLDPRAALFVLSPVSQSEIGDFVRSLQEALYEPALEYYTTHSKRVRRKRNRHSQANSSYPMPHAAGAGTARPLRPRDGPSGTNIRWRASPSSEEKTKHYQDSYSSLLVMFGSTAILPPRTKRWAEAKVLADCISLKIVKLYLYNNEHALALSHHNSHMRKFADFSRGWGIGEETFEFWSWLARQHRVFAELLEQGTRSTLKIPTQHATPSPSAATVAVQAAENSQMAIDAMRVLGLNPTQALQHPGFYYYMAAHCTEMRRERFLSALESESTQHSSPGFMNEKKVDHLTIILEVRDISYRIAQTYYESGKFDMAVRFFERIAKTYRREKWVSLLRPLLSQWYACAQQLGDMELSVRLLVEMLGYGRTSHQNEPDALQEDLMAVLKSTVPLTRDEPLVVDAPDSEPILNSSVAFWNSEVNVGEAAVYQLSLSAPANTSMSSLPFSSVSIHFSGDIPPIFVRHSEVDSQDQAPLVQRVDVGHAVVSATSHGSPREAEGNLRWGCGSTIVFAGSLSSEAPTHLTITKVVLTLKEGSWWIEIPLHVTGPHHDLLAARWLTSLHPVSFMPIRRENHSSVTIHYRPHQVHVSLSYHGPAYIGEGFPITIEIDNADDRELEITVDVLLQPTDIDDAVNHVALDDQRSTSLIKGITCGVIGPGVGIVKTLYLINAGCAGDRTVDISVQSRSTASPSSPITPNSPSSPSIARVIDRGETLRTLVVPAIEPIEVTYEVSYRRSLNPQPGLADLETYKDGYWDESNSADAIVTNTISCAAPSVIMVESISLRPQVRFDLLYRILPDGGHGTLSISRFPLPSLRPPMDGLVALLDTPTTARLHVPIPLRLTVRNRQPSRSANITVHLEPDNSDAFVLAGLRSGRLPILLPGAEETITWNMIPIECGLVNVPRIKVVDRRKAIAYPQGAAGQQEQTETEGDVVKIVDVRWDGRVTGEFVAQKERGSSDSARNTDIAPRPMNEAVILVLP
ncbi:Trafficking protein particle complex subunit 11 [Grifola frondosa]|uniref:Trafficking protein particle complex subunit 11 n=1 Tax=Grifola frondosa TaxID=5627 RepID=A0A1C7LZ70_GRIFR|nr:Trafficking protein particle complex subunit 11 [Grifola frondosa]